MKNFIATITLTLAFCSIGFEAFAWDYYSTPRFGGGYNFYGDGWSGYSTPRFGGGSNFYFNDWIW